MQLTVGQVYDVYTVLEGLMHENDQRPFPLVCSYRLARLYSVLAPDGLLIAQKRAALIRELGQPLYAADGKTVDKYYVPEDTPEKDKYVEEWGKLKDEPIDIANVEKIPLSSFGAGPVLRPREMFFLMPVIETTI